MENSDSEYNRLEWLCRCLLDENPRYRHMPVPDSLQERRDFFRALMNVRPPVPVSEEFLRVQDEELQAQLAEKGVVEILRIAQNGIVEWQGDITRLKVDAIVNAANSQMLGVLCTDAPLH